MGLALRELHSIGWVHRDISSGNILVVDGHAKIADFEYAKHENDFTMHGVRTVRFSLVKPSYILGS